MLGRVNIAGSNGAKVIECDAVVSDVNIARDGTLFNNGQYGEITTGFEPNTGTTAIKQSSNYLTGTTSYYASSIVATFILNEPLTGTYTFKLRYKTSSKSGTSSIYISGGATNKNVSIGADNELCTYSVSLDLINVTNIRVVFVSASSSYPTFYLYEATITNLIAKKQNVSLTSIVKAKENDILKFSVPKSIKLNELTYNNALMNVDIPYFVDETLLEYGDTLKKLDGTLLIEGMASKVGVINVKEVGVDYITGVERYQVNTSPELIYLNGVWYGFYDRCIHKFDKGKDETLVDLSSFINYQYAYNSSFITDGEKLYVIGMKKDSNYDDIIVCKYDPKTNASSFVTYTGLTTSGLITCYDYGIASYFEDGKLHILGITGSSLVANQYIKIGEAILNDDGTYTACSDIVAQYDDYYRIAKVRQAITNVIDINGVKYFVARFYWDTSNYYPQLYVFVKRNGTWINECTIDTKINLGSKTFYKSICEDYIQCFNGHMVYKMTKSNSSNTYSPRYYRYDDMNKTLIEYSSVYNTTALSVGYGLGLKGKQVFSLNNSNYMMNEFYIKSRLG